MSQSKLNRVMYWVGFAGLMVVGFCYGYNMDTVLNS